jgi:lysine 2,3-aminomutase
MTDSYRQRPDFFADVGKRAWKDWTWQQRNALRSCSGLKSFFSLFPVRWERVACEWERKGFRFMVTPYVLSLIKRDKKGNPRENDPVWRQVFPYFGGDKAFEVRGTLKVAGPDEYSPLKENWEEAREMITPICQHKYENRAIIFVADSCLGYCMYCFRSLQSCAGEERHGGLSLWEKTLKEIRKRPEIEEVILSGGDPLILSNDMLGKLLGSLRKIKTIRFIRIHTRAWTHNPFRIDHEFCALLKKYAVTEMGVHTIHPNEISGDFQAAVGRVRESGARTMLLADIPLIKGVNDNVSVLRKLFTGLYGVGVKPYYLSHNMPNIPHAAEQRTSVREGLVLYNKLKRRISNPAMPEYIITHKSGKKTVPECAEGTPDFVYGKDKNGWPVIHFRDWNGKWQTYLDAKGQKMM